MLTNEGNEMTEKTIKHPKADSSDPKERELAEWIAEQKANRDKLSPRKRQQLESLPGWNWDT
jgi:hypothetical protein